MSVKRGKYDNCKQYISLRHLKEEAVIAQHGLACALLAGLNVEAQDERRAAPRSAGKHVSDDLLRHALAQIGGFPHVCCAVNNCSHDNGSDCFSS